MLSKSLGELELNLLGNTEQHCIIGPRRAASLGCLPREAWGLEVTL